MANMNKVLKTRIVQKFDSADNWARSPLVLLRGELAIDDLGRVKVGNGIDTWSGLPFIVDGRSTAISFPTELPDASSEACKAGELVLTPDGKLWCLTGSDETPAERAWVDLTNKAEIEELQSALQSGLVALKAEMTQKDEAHDAAIIALQASLGSETSSLADDVATNAENIGTLRLQLDETMPEVEALASAFDVITGESDNISIKRRLKVDALPTEIYDSGTGLINSAALPSYVDDVVEGIVSIGNSSNPDEKTYSLTHGDNGSVVGFFKVDGADVEGATRNLQFVSTATKESILDVSLGVLDYTQNNITYVFPPKPAEALVAPSSSIIYVDVTTNKAYRWSGSQFVVIAADLALGETASTAYAGDKGAAVYDEVFREETGLQARATAIESEIEELKSADSNHTVAISALSKECEDIRAEAEQKHQELEDEFASGIVALKQESELADKAHNAAIVALQNQISNMGSSVEAMNLETVLSNSGDTLNNDYIIINCGDAEAPVEPVNP